MTKIESKHVEVAASQKAIYDYLMDLNNLQELLPKDKVSDFKSDGESCSFKVMNAYTIGLEHQSSTEPDNIILKSTDGGPLSFDLDVKIKAIADKCKVNLVSNADINPFMKMMVEKPLRNLFDYIAERLTTKF